MSMETYYKNYLSHHGIRGQKWGKKNGPPYPLGPGDHSASERKAGWRKSLDKDSNTDDTKEKFHLTDKQKKYLKIGAGVVAASLITAGGLYLYKNGKINSDVFGNLYGGKEEVERILDFDIVDTKSKISNYSEKVQDEYYRQLDIVRDINPTGSRQNCGVCSVLCHINDEFRTNFKASDLPMKHYDDMKLLFNNYDSNRKVAVDKNGLMTDDIREEFDLMTDFIKRHPDGSSGVCSGHWNIKSPFPGHFIRWKLVDNAIIFSDGQNNNVYVDDEAFDGIFSKMGKNTLAFMRLDTFDPIEEAIKKISINN